MKRYLSVCLLALSLPALALAADGPTLKSARSRFLHGNYEEAISQYEQLAKDAARSRVLSQ